MANLEHLWQKGDSRGHQATVVSPVGQGKRPRLFPRQREPLKFPTQLCCVGFDWKEAKTSP